MMLHVHAKVFLHMWLYDFYDIMFSTKYQRHHMITRFINPKPYYQPVSVSLSADNGQVLIKRAKNKCHVIICLSHTQIHCLLSFI